jgi:cell division protein FtsB
MIGFFPTLNIAESQHCRMKISQTPRRIPGSDDHSTLEWIVSLLFWGQMVVAASLYGVVALAPKLTAFVELQNKHLKTQTQLVSLENHIHELEKVVVSLQDDPRVIEELARLDLDAARPDETRIPLEGGVTLQSRLGQSMHVPDVGRAWYQPLLQAFAEHTSLRVTSLAVAAALVVISFTFFHPSQARSFHSGWRNLRAACAACVARYRGRPVR